MDNRDKIIAENLGLVHSCAHRFKGKGIEYDDLFQAGCIGLIKAYDGFDTTRGVKLSTYAVPVILGEIKRLFRDGGALKVSRTLKELSMKVVRERENFTVRTGREPTVSELAERLCVSSEEIAEALGVSAPPLSLTESEEEGGGQFDVEIEAPQNEVADMLALKEVVSGLPPQDRQLIILRYFQSKTQVQTAAELGITQVQVSRREKKILTQLRRKLTG